MMLDRVLEFRFPLTSGADVRAAQQALARAGLLAGDADGVFGPRTRDAVATWQQRRGLPADGVLRPAQWAVLLPEAPAARAAAPDWRAALAPFLARLAVPHGVPVGDSARRWRLTPGGVLLLGEDAPRRTLGAPRTVATCWDRHAAGFQAAAQRFGVPLELLLATACTESGGRADAVRQEPGYVSDSATPHKVSPGLMQTLIATARASLHDPTLDRARLLDPACSIAAGAALIRQQALQAARPTGFDPVLVGIAYNAGSLRPMASCPWGLVQTKRDATSWHADAFCAFFGDALAVLAQDPPDAATPNWAALLRG
jgi:soluble lytic murein transglycosylase-like protein